MKKRVPKSWATSSCPDCRAIYNDPDPTPGDYEQHLRRHQRADHLAAVLGSSHLNYDEREALKREGQRFMEIASTLGDKVHAANLMVEGRYHRFLEVGAVNASVPTLKEYALYDDGLEAQFGRELGAAVRDHWLKRP